jgi:alanine dehydrogenase
MTLRIVDDNEVREKLSMKDAVEAIENVLDSISKEKFLSPPRHYVKNNNGSLAFTIGGDLDEGVIGFRVYDTFPTEVKHEQFVTVFDARTGRLKGIVTGDYIGAARTGAIGGVAVKYLSNPDSETLGVVGAGKQAETQIYSAVAVRPIKVIKIFSRDPKNLSAFVDRISKKLANTKITAMQSPEEAVYGCDIVVTATTSSTPVIESSWLKPGCHINSVGPKFKERNEIDVEIALNSQHIYSDSVAQLKNYPDKHFLFGTDAYDNIRELYTGPLVGRRRVDRTLFLSVGLSGTEPSIANLLLEGDA